MSRINKILATLYIATTLWSNTIQSQQPLKIGDTVPDIVFSKMLNYPTPTATLADFKGKFVILDFWSVYCKVCLVAFDHLYKVQQQMGDQVVILPVGFFSGRDGTEKPEAFLEKRRLSGREMKLPTAIIWGNEKQSQLFHLFPYNGLPHEVWIDSNGTLRAITDHTAVTKANIQAMICQPDFRLHEKTFQQSYDINLPLLVNGNAGAADAFTYRSIITRGIDSISNVEIHRTDAKSTRLLFTNTTIQRLYKSAYDGAGLSPSNASFRSDSYQRRLRFFTRDTMKTKDLEDMVGMSYSQLQEFNRHNLFCYELILPSGRNLQEAYHAMIQDLDRYFKISSSIRREKVSCLALVRTKSKQIVKNSEDRLQVKVSEEGKEITIRNGSGKYLTDFLSIFKELPLVINKLKDNDHISLSLTINEASDLTAIRSQLIPYGLDLQPIKEEVTVLVLKQSN